MEFPETYNYQECITLTAENNVRIFEHVIEENILQYTLNLFIIDI